MGLGGDSGNGGLHSRENKEDLEISHIRERGVSGPKRGADKTSIVLQWLSGMTVHLRQGPKEPTKEVAMTDAQKCPDCGEVHPPIEIRHDAEWLEVRQGDAVCRTRGEPQTAAHLGLWIDRAKCLERQLAQAVEREKQAEEREAMGRTELDAWHKVFETTQLDHAQARMEKAEADV